MLFHFSLVFNKRHMDSTIKYISPFIWSLPFSIHNLFLALSQKWLLRVRMVIFRIKLGWLICSSCFQLIKFVFYWMSICLRLTIFWVRKWFFYLPIASAIVIWAIDGQLRKVIRASFKLANYLACRADWPASILLNP